MNLAHGLESDERESDMAITYFDVTTYGAVGDDSTDDTSSIQSAVSAAEVNGGTVYFPRGTYLVTGTIVINGNSVALLGDGELASTIDVNFASGDGLLFGPSTGSTGRNSINKMGFTSNKLQRITGPLIHIQNCNTFNISEVFIGIRSYDGLFIDGADCFDVFISRTTIIDCSSAGLRLGSNTQPANIFVSDCEFGSNAYGVYLTNVSGLYMQNTSILQNTSANFVTYPSPGQSVQFLFLQSVISDTTLVAAAFALIDNGGAVTDINMVNCWGSSCLYGVQTGHVDGLIISSCRFLANKQEAILISYGNNIDISGCQIFANSQNGNNEYAGIRITPNISNFKITNNRIGVGGGTRTYPNQQSYGIIINSGSSSDFIVANNAFVGNRSGGILNDSTGGNTIIVDNITS